MKRKLLAFTLVMCMFYSMVSPGLAQSGLRDILSVNYEDTLVPVKMDDQIVENDVVLPHHEHIKLTADCEADSYQWQIHAYDIAWVNISEANTDTLDLSYAMVASLLDENSKAAIRCVANIDGQAEYSNEIIVAVDFETESLGIIEDNIQPEVITGTLVYCTDCGEEIDGAHECYTYCDVCGEVIIGNECACPFDQPQPLCPTCGGAHVDCGFVEDEPVEDEPVEDEPVEDEPVEDEPVEEESEGIVSAFFSLLRNIVSPASEDENDGDGVYAPSGRRGGRAQYLRRYL